MRVYHLTYDFFEFDSRILKELKSLSNLEEISDLLLITALRKKELPSTTSINNKVKIQRLNNLSYFFKPGGIFQYISYIYWHFLVLRKSIFQKPDIVHCHNAETLFLGKVIQILFSAKLIYDAHELETERGESRIMLTYFYLVEKLFLRGTDCIIVVNESIKKHYLSKFNLKTNQIVTIKNIPIHVLPRKKLFKLRKYFNIKKGKLLFGYIGMLGPNRGIEMMLNYFKNNPEKHIVFIGFGNYKNKISNYSKKYDNIHLHKPVKMDKISSILSEIDVGICLIEKASLNYYYSLPNKFFEYIHGGVPVICSNFPEMKYLVNKYDCGWLISPNSNSFHRVINSLNTNEIKSKTNNTKKLYKYLNWGNEEEKLQNIYYKLLKI